MLKEKVAKMMKLAVAGMMLALGVAAAAPAATVQADMLVESEPNDNPASVNKLPLNTWIRGKAGSGDQDWYEINIPSQGVSYLEIKPDETNTNSRACWYTKLLDENRNILWNFETNEGVRTTTWEKGWAPGKYYLVISGSWPYVDVDYNFIFHYQESDDWEKEFYCGNKNFSNANEVEVNKWYNGILYCGDDVDYYHFKLNGTNKISLDFKIDDRVANPGRWVIEFYEYSTRKYIGKTEVNTNTTVTKECTGDAIVKIRTYSPYSAANQPYHIQASVVPQNKIDSTTTVTPTPTQAPTPSNTTVVKPSATQITSIKPGKKQATIRWKKASNATGYYVYRSTKAKGGYKKIATVNGKTTYKDKKALKSKKTYYYKVISYRKNDSKVLKSRASGYKKVKVK